MWASPHGFRNLVFLPNQSAEMGLLTHGADRFQHCFQPEASGHDEGVCYEGKTTLSKEKSMWLVKNLMQLEKLVTQTRNSWENLSPPWSWDTSSQRPCICSPPCLFYMVPCDLGTGGRERAQPSLPCHEDHYDPFLLFHTQGRCH